MENMTKEQAKEIVAKKYGLGTTLVTGHKASYWEEAMDLVLASGSVAAPKEEGLNIPWDSDYYESRIKELKEALKELLKFADMYLHSKVLEYARGNFEKSELEDSAAIIERARKLLSK